VKTILRYFLINLVSLWVTTELIKGLSYNGGAVSLIIGAITFAAINIIIVPLLKILLLPLNLLTLGIFAWITNVLALYALTSLVPQFSLSPFIIESQNLNGLITPNIELSTLWVAILASLLIGLITHFLQWLMH
jgi:putative membrane protein